MTLYVTLASLIDRLEEREPDQQIIYWASPVPSFGDISLATVATVGLNPSSREFIDSTGKELDGPNRRLHTLRSLGLDTWEEADSRHLDSILDACAAYFEWKPYDTWFRKMDSVLSATGTSFYDSPASACHLDLIPYASTRKWAELTVTQRSSLISTAGDTLAMLVRDSPIHTLVLNGASVVELFQSLGGVSLVREEMPAWSLPRTSHKVKGFAYSGSIETLFGVDLNREVSVYGYNHNLQSSFGVTNGVVSAIASWLQQVARQPS